MNKLLVIILFLLTAACTTLSGFGTNSKSSSAASSDGSAPHVVPGERPEIIGLEDMDFGYIESTWGKADHEAAVAGKRVITYKNIVSTSEDPETDTTITQLCDIELKIGNEGIVEDWEYKTCRPKAK